MENSNSLFALGLEYEAAAAKVKERLDKKRAKLRSLRNSICSHEAYVLKSEIATLYDELRETKTMAEYLKNYYTNKDTLIGGALI